MTKNPVSKVRCPVQLVIVLLAIDLCPLAVWAAAPPSPVGALAVDHPWDDGNSIDVLVILPENAVTTADEEIQYVVEQAGESPGVFEEAARVSPSEKELTAGKLRVVIDKLVQGVGSSRVDLQACKLEYSIVSPK